MSRGLLDVLLDVDDAARRDALAAAFAPHRVHVVSATLDLDPAVPAPGPAATRAAADLAADVIVVAPAPDAEGDPLHDALALRPRRWVAAAGVVGARVVLVSADDVFDPAACPPDGHDEFTPGDAVDPVGRARRAGEAEVLGGAAGDPAAGHVVVRAAVDDDPEELASLVRWAATPGHGGAWHLPGSTSPRLHARHTRLVRAETAPREGQS